MKFITVMIIFLASTLFSVHIASAHGVTGAIAEKKALLVTAEYDDGEPMGYGAVEIINLEENQMDTNQKHGFSHGSSLPRYERILMGISFIFGIFGFLFWWKGRKNKSVV